MADIVKNNIIHFFLIVICLSIFGTGCVQQKAATASETPAKVENNAAKSATDAEVEAAQKIIKNNPEAAAGYLMLSRAYIRLARETGDFKINTQAENAIDQALKIEPQNLNALKLKNSLQITFHRFAEARANALELLRQYPNDSFFYGVLTDANSELGNYEEAVAAAQKMVDLKPDMTSYIRVAQMRSLHGDGSGAIEAMKLAASSADPSDKEAQAWCLSHLGDEYFKIGNYPQAEQNYDRALQIFPNYHFALAGKGKTRAAQNDFEAAVKFLTEAQNKVPLTDTVIYLGDVYARKGDAANAQKQYELAEFIEGKIGDSSDRRRLALLWADRDIKLDEALDIARREHETRKDILTADIYAWCLYKKGDITVAQKIIGEAMRLKTKDARIFYHAAMIEKAAGNEAKAKTYLKNALDTNPAFDLIQAEKAKAI